MKSFAFVLIACLWAGGYNLSAQPTFDWLPDSYRPDNEWVKQVGARSFPKGKTFWVNASGDGKTICTEQIQAVIDQCAAEGGGRVCFNAGTYLTGALFLRSGVDLHIDREVCLQAVPDLRHYPTIETRIAGIEMSWPAAVINVLDQQNVAISGEGKLDCRGKVFWDKYWKMRKEYEAKGLRWIIDYDCERVRGILVSRSSDVTVKDLHIFQPGFWTLQLLYSEYCTVEGLTIRNNTEGRGPSTDGIDIDSSSRILVQACDIDCNDDNICLKSGRDWDGLRVNRPTEYVVIRDCISRQGAGLVTCGSETSGGISHILGYRLKSFGTNAAIRFKSAMNRGGYIRNVYFSDIEAQHVGSVIVAELNWNPAYSYSALPEAYRGKELPPHWNTMLKEVTPKERGYTYVSDIYIEKVRFDQCRGAFIKASGMGKQLPLKNFWLKDMKGNAHTGGLIRNVENIYIEDLELSTEDGTEVKMQENKQTRGAIQYKAYEKPSGLFDRTLNQRTDGSKVMACSHPEFAFLFPEMAGNFKLGISQGDQSTWLGRKEIKSVQETGKGLRYELEVEVPGKKTKARLSVLAVALKESGGIVLSVEGSQLEKDSRLYWAFGAASGETITSGFGLLPAYCADNVFSVEGNAFTTYYGESMRLRVIQGVVPPTSEIRLSDANRQFSPEEFFQSGKRTNAPALAAMLPMKEGEKYYFCFYRQNKSADYNYYMLPALF